MSLFFVFPDNHSILQH